MTMDKEVCRCDWATRTKVEQEYHDHVWGVPEHDERRLFKMLNLEGQQAGLSWVTILNKMDALCEAFDDFHPEKLIAYDENKIEELMNNPGIIRNRRKIESAIKNARAYFKLCEEEGSLEQYLWKFVDGKPIVNHWQTAAEIPPQTELSEKISKDMKKRGFSFVGPTIIYAYMQSIGMVNDHLVTCSFRFSDQV